MKGFFLFRLPKKLLLAGAGAALALVVTGVAVGGVRMVSGGQKSVQLPIVMYHHILEDSRLLGDYVISSQQLESDLQYIRDQGYTPVLPREVAAWVRGEGELPQKPIMITFDDGNKSAFVYAYPLLKKHGMKAALAVIGIHSEKYSAIDDDNVSYAHATWEELGELENSGVFEIANHTYNMHEESYPRRGTMRGSGESLEDYRAALRDDLSTNQQMLTAAIGHEPKTFAYPFGFIDRDADSVIEELGFDVTFGVEEKVPTIVQGDPGSLLKLGRFNRPYSATTKTFFDRIFSQIRSSDRTA